MSKQFNKRTIACLICLIVILASFLLLPWFGINFDSLGALGSSLSGENLNVSGSALMFPIKLVTGKAGILSQLKAISDTTASTLNGFTVYAFTWYLILAFAVFAAVNFAMNHDQAKFAEYTFFTFVASVGVCVILLIVRAVIISRIMSNETVSALSSLVRLGGYSVEDAVRKTFELGAGFYLIFITALIGMIFVLVFRRVMNSAEGGKMQGAGIVRELLYGDDLAGQVYRSSEIENPYKARRQPAVILTDGRQTLEIYDLRGSIGSGVNATHRVTDISIKPAHCEIRSAKGAVAIQALDPQTWLNGKAMSPGVYYRLMNGDRLTLGNITFTVRINQNQGL